MMTADSTIQVAILNAAAPVAFAATELARHLALLAPATPVASASATADASDEQGLRLGTFADFGADSRPWPAVADAALDDAIYIEADNGAGIIAGSNPRGVLLAVYRYLTELGCRWVRPGPDGAFIPRVDDLRARTVRVAEAASYRHRGICIEGAVSFEHVRDLLDWAPKVGFNTYFTQFRESFTFFERWYTHRENPLLPPEPFTVEQARALKARLAGELAQRGIVFHDVGHGWTCEPLGIPGLGWEYPPPPVPVEAVPYLAEVNGRRGLWHGVPLNTQLCYSNPEVRRLMVDDVAAFARAHPEVDVLHIWLGDGTNNHCECAECRQLRPADWYVRLLNEMDARLTAERLPVRLVFLVYVDLLWPPEHEALQNPDRFILMFAPITRTYSVAFAADEPASTPELPPYERNRLQFPRSVADNVAFLRAWQRLFTGDSFDYDYHLMWDHYLDPGEIASATVVHEDMRGLAALGLNGLVSCQEQRVFFPSGLAMTVMGRTLWNRDLAFRAIADDHFTAVFGADGAACLAYCEELSRLFDPPYLRGEKPRHDLDVAAAYARVPEVIAAFRPTIARNLNAADPCHARSWRYLARHADLCVLLAGALQHRATGDDDAARRGWEAARDFVREIELDVHPVLDSYECQRVLGRLFAPVQNA
ncbi:MAG: DUF4838 domain-containing protein [Thermomicrobiales bacterium]